MAQLILMFKETVLDTFPLYSDEGATIGRHHSNRIVIENLAVSGHHARVDVGDEGLSLIDLQSKNGTYVNDEKVTECPLAHKDIILVGKHILMVDLNDEMDLEDADGHSAVSSDGPSPMSEAKTMFLDTSHGRQMRGEEEPPPPPPEPVYADNDNLSFIDGGEGDISLSQTQVTIGKNKDADIVIGGAWALLAGSPCATISKQAGDYFLRFSGGLIKPKRNGAGIKGTIKLNHDDVLEIGPVKLRVQLRKRSTMD